MFFSQVVFFVLFFVLAVFFFLNIFTVIVLNSLNRTLLQSFDEVDTNSDGVVTRDEFDNAIHNLQVRGRNMSGTLCAEMMAFDIPHKGKLYNLKRRPRVSTLELHMDLMDSTKAKLLQQCVTPHQVTDSPLGARHLESDFGRVLSSDHVEIEEEMSTCICQ